MYTFGSVSLPRTDMVSSVRPTIVLVPIFGSGNRLTRSPCRGEIHMRKRHESIDVKFLLQVNVSLSLLGKIK